MLTNLVNFMHEFHVVIDRLVRVFLSVGVLLIASDVVLGTEIGILGRCLKILGSLGIQGQTLTVVVLATILLILVNQKKA